jgi:hypothetical protein
MKPGKLDLPPIWRGCDWGPVTLKWKDQNGDPIDVRQWQAVAQSLNINLNPSMPDGENGVTQLALTRAQTASLKLGVESWDWIWQRPLGTYRYPPFLSGSVEIKEPVSGTNGSAPPVLPPDPPVAIAATDIRFNRFDANWEASSRATGYRLDVASDTAFTQFVPGFQNLDVGNVTTYTVVNVTALRTYHYRLRAYNTGGTTVNSNVIHVTTPAVPPPPNDNFSNAIVMPGTSGSMAGTNYGATREAGEPAGDYSVWYKWTPGDLSLAGVAIDTIVNRISVYFSSDPVNPDFAHLVHVADSNNNQGHPLVLFNPLATTYYIRIYTATGGISTFTMEWNYQP